MRTPLLMLVCHLLAAGLFAQTDSTLALREVVVSGFHETAGKSTSLNIQPYSLAKLEVYGPHNLSDALAHIPGIAQLSTGNAISKPVIRGLYGNRILILLSGLRFDNQQWQDEHGLGLSQIGIERVEVIKGPASLLYGTDALGGVVNVVEETPAFRPGHQSDASVRLSSNTLGLLTDLGFQKSRDKVWWRLRAGYENHGDYSDGRGKRVLNARNTGYYLRSGLGFRRKNWSQENTYNLSYNQYGFILEGLSDFFEADKRWSRAMAGPHHNVLLNILNSKNTFSLPNSTVKLHAGLQSNLRQEDEGGGQISLNMHLFSVLENLRWEKPLSRRLLLILNQQFTFENNTNYGGRIIIPDANLMEVNLAGYLRFFTPKIALEAGLSGNNKYIKTFVTRTLNQPGAAVEPFEINRPSMNGMLGVSYNPTERTNLKWNFSSGFRAPNLAELSSNGLHEGVFRYEIGDPKLRVEQNFNNDLTFDYHGRQFFVNVSGFYNQFRHYVYLAPTDEDFFGFDVFRYRQQNARLFGGEMSAAWQPLFLKTCQWKESIALTKGTLQDGGYLPFIPAYKLSSSIRWEHQKGLRKLYAEPEWVYVFDQNNPAVFETRTEGYALLNVMAGVAIPVSHANLEFTLSGKNLLNTVYADHLSRLKYYGLYNPGVNVVLATKVTWR